MSERTTYRLGDIIKVKHGFAFKGEYFSDEPTNDILLTPGNFKIGGGFKTDKFKYYKGEVPDDYVLKEGDILITMTDLSKAGDTLGYSAKIPAHSGVRFLHNQRLGLVQFQTDKFDTDYLYWVLRTQPYQFYIVGSATGSTVKHTSPTRICSYAFEAPSDKKTQSQIGSILSSLDNKIELNLQMNQTLETVAQAIFKEWFVKFNFPGFDGELVDGLPKGWNETILDNVVDLIIDHRGKTPTKLGGEWVLKGVPAISAKNVKDGRLINLTDVGYINEDLFKKWMKDKLEPFDILLTSEGPLGEVAIVINNINYCLSQRLFAIRTNAKCSASYLYLYLRSEIGKLNVSKRATGSTVVGIRQSELRQVEVLLPSNDVQLRFDEIVIPLLQRIDDNYNEIETLTQIRDSLLPKLMAGKIEVKL